MKSLKRKAIMLVLVMMMSLFGTTFTVLAAPATDVLVADGESGGSGEDKWGGVMEEIKNKADEGGDTGIAGLGNQVKSAGGELWGVMRIVGLVAAIISVAFAGIILIFGNPQERSQTKQKVLFIVLGIIFIFGATTFVLSFINFAEGLAG